MAEASIPVDLFNPGQVFACIGLVEVADVLLGDAEGVFDWSAPSDVRFWVRARGEASPIERVLRFFDEATAIAVAPATSACLDEWNESWGDRPSERDRSEGYPYPDPPSPATLVCGLNAGDESIELDYWGDATKRDNVKFWAGSGGQPGSALARNALRLVRGRAVVSADPFNLSAPQSSSFGLDWRRDYIPLQLGFSLNKHGNIEAIGFPLVELLAAVGLGNARPHRPDWRNKLSYEYAVIGRESREQLFWLPPNLLRTGLGVVSLPFPMRRFRMLLDWPAKEGQARAITVVTEETVA